MNQSALDSHMSILEREKTLLNIHFTCFEVLNGINLDRIIRFFIAGVQVKESEWISFFLCQILDMPESKCVVTVFKSLLRQSFNQFSSILEIKGIGEDLYEKIVGQFAMDFL